MPGLVDCSYVHFAPQLPNTLHTIRTHGVDDRIAVENVCISTTQTYALDVQRMRSNCGSVVYFLHNNLAFILNDELAVSNR